METMEARGRTGSVSFDGERVTIAHKLGTKVMPIHRISHTLYRRAGVLTNGSWGVAVDGQVVDQRAIIGARAALDANIIIIQGRRQAKAFDELDAAVNEVLLGG